MCKTSECAKISVPGHPRISMFANGPGHSRTWSDPPRPLANRRSSGVGIYTYITYSQFPVPHSKLSTLNMDNSIASINPFPNDVRIAFQSYIQGPNYVNRERIPYAKWR